MAILRIEHAVPSYEGWKHAFDSDPLDREGSGVRRYRIHRAADDPDYVIIDLEFDTVAEAEVLLTGLRTMWQSVEGTLMSDPRARVAETVESLEY